MPKRIPPLTDLQVSKAKAQGKQVTLFDGGGLFVLVTLTGSKLWRFKYRFGGKEKLLSLGSYPEVSIADARGKRTSFRKLLSEGVDPGEVKKAEKLEKIAQVRNAFETVARDWHARFKSQWSEKHAEQILRRLEQDVFPWIGARPIGEIKAPELLTVLRRIEARSLETAFRVKIACGQVFRYAVAEGRADRDPVADLKGALPPVKNKNFAAPTDPTDVASLLRAIDDYKGSYVVKCAMQLAPLLFVRPGELRHAEWSEIDLEAAEWNIPGAKMKMGVPHLVPLPKQAVQILRGLHLLTGHDKYVFPCMRSTHRCMSENAVNAGLRRLGFEKSEITGHGFRAMARTILDEVLQVRPELIEHQLAHQVRDPLGRAYNRTTHLAERRKMMQTWADYLDGLKAGAMVLPLKRVT
ncbi:tyrosine-type recombinase/integrase [Geomonas anaerohicana]|uniref:Integrase arm-type DNA-binding domain-containing protein n=1 Tax=Geomonas anaerohicana TaxID=2798583 RepID=A0ABS0YDY1_9BACT|nr:integrase arm-type DNA-binding domain-containing protein [Geomonas anaerohicana]MBJ6750486.1 integrase arm-type DNA-binding domain-containing protein [Geomonas anaerohicana]